MNQELHDYIDELIDCGINSLDQLSKSAKKKILGCLLRDSKEPLNFMTETDCHKQFIHNLSNYLIGNSFISILDIYSDIENSAWDYHKDAIEEDFNQVKTDKVGAYPKDIGLHDYAVRRGE